MQTILITGDEAIESGKLAGLIALARERAVRLAGHDHPAMRALGERAGERADRLAAILAGR